MSGFAVNNVTPRVQIIATQGQTTFSFTFQFYIDGDITVYYTPFGSQPNDVLQLLGTNFYSIINEGAATTPGGPKNGGQIFMSVTPTTPLNAGDIITIVRNTPDQRQNYYINGGLFNQTMVNADFNDIILMIQQLMMCVSVAQDPTEAGTRICPGYNLSANPQYPLDLVLPQLPGNCTWQMNSTGTQIIAVPINVSGTSGNVTVSPLPTTTNAFAKFSNTTGVITSSGISEPTTGNITGVVSIDGVPWPPNTATWVGVSTNTAMAAGNNYYVLSPGGTLQMTLPTTIAAGTVIAVAGFSATGWIIKQNAGQQIFFGDVSTTLGTTGSIASTNAKDNIELLCVVANTTFVVLSGVGNMTIV